MVLDCIHCGKDLTGEAIMLVRLPAETHIFCFKCYDLLLSRNYRSQCKHPFGLKYFHGCWLDYDDRNIGHRIGFKRKQEITYYVNSLGYGFYFNI